MSYLDRSRWYCTVEQCLIHTIANLLQTQVAQLPWECGCDTQDKNVSELGRQTKGASPARREVEDGSEYNAVYNVYNLMKTYMYMYM